MQIHMAFYTRLRRLSGASLLGLAALLGTAGLGVPASADETAAEPGADPTESGRQLYIQQCARCHQQEGTGVQGLYPPLRNAKDLWTDRERPIRTLLAGRSGPVEVDGRLFDHVMPTHGYLANETIAATLTFLLQEWGPGGAPYTAEEIAAVRLTLLADHSSTYYALPDASPLRDMEAVQYVTSEGPPMSVEEFEEARRLYYGNCTGCHGVLREGTAGNPLTPEIMRERGTEYLQAVINYGASSGMPNWGTAELLTPKQINLLARYLQHPVPQPPDMDEYQIRDGWRQLRAVADRPTRPQHDYDLDALFAVTLHDLGQVMLIDGKSRDIVATVEVGSSPHKVTASASGRYLYAICRDGTLSMIDLFASPPERVATVRIGYEARAVGASMHPDYPDRYVLAGAYWPPHLLLLDGQTLEPLRLVSTRGYSSKGRRYHPEPRVTDIAGSTAHPEFVAQIKETGHTYLFPYDRLDPLQIRSIETVRELRAGSLAVDGRHYLTPADTNAVSVLDLQEQRIAAEIPARVFGAGTGVAYEHRKLGPVWVTSTMVDSELLVFGTDPERHKDRAWQIAERATGPAAGSLFLATHARSDNLWMDTPLASDPKFSQSVAVFRRDALGDGFRSLPIANWSGLTEGPRRAVQPTYDDSGKEVWVIVWNPQDQGSSIVVVDDRTLEPKATITDNRLITPTRIYNVGQLRAGRTE
jgi:nitrite reductase (NO-forming)/hydroxylamine reductase